MTVLINLRKELGLTQQELADYLSITRGHLAMIEKGRRKLNRTIELKISLLENAVIHSELAEVREDNAQSAPEYELHADDCLLRAKTAEQKLDAMKADYSTQQKLLQTLQFLRKDLTQKAEILWLESREAAAKEKIKDCGPFRQAKLSSSIQELYNKAAFLRRA